MQFGPSLESDDFATGGRLGQTLEANIGRQGHLNATRAQQEADLLRSSVASRQRHFDGNGHNAGVQTTVKGANETNGVAVGIDQGNPIAGFDARTAQQFGRTAAATTDTTTAAMFAQFVQKSVGDFVRAALQFAYGKEENEKSITFER